MNQDLLLRAARLLEFQAREVQRASTIDGRWTADALNDGADTTVAELRRAAIGLRTEAGVEASQAARPDGQFAITLARAAQILVREAEALHRGHFMPAQSTWDDDEIRYDHDEMLAISRTLRTRAKTS